MTAILNLPFGMHETVSAADYHADRLTIHPTLSRSCADTLVTRSPLHAMSEHPKLNPVATPGESSAEMDFGDVAHELMLGHGRGFAIFEGETWRGNEAKAFREQAEADGLTAIKRADYSRALAAVSEWRRQLTAMNLGHVFTEAGKAEMTFLWEESPFCQCRARLDWCQIEENYYEVWDLKTTENAHPKTVDKQIGNMNYDLQEAWNMRAVWNCFPKLMGRGKFRFLFAETKPPFAILPYETDGSYKCRGEDLVQRGIAGWADCREKGLWPAYTDKLYRGEAPPWMMPKPATP